jgi:diguanylate cyclase (GGDEF)-like protein
MLIVIGAYAFDMVASTEHGLISPAIDLGMIGLALMGLWSLAHRGRHHPELVVWIMASGAVFTMVATGVAVPDLAIQEAGYLLILPGLAALLLPWRTSTYAAWFVLFLIVTVGYLALVPGDGLTPDVRGGLITVLAAASGASLAGHALLERARLRTFSQVEHIRALHSQGDAYIAQITHTANAMRTLETTAAQLEQRALHDPLTGLANRTLLGDRLAQALAQRGTVVALVMLDLDDFKAVNDRLGHGAGDSVLLGAAERFTAVLRSGDTLARLGGDEFAVVAPAVKDAAVACAIADRLLGSLCVPVRLNSTRRGVETVAAQASAGIAVVTAGTCEAEELMRRADVALYRAKAKGRNQWDLYEASTDTEA